MPTSPPAPLPPAGCRFACTSACSFSCSEAVKLYRKGHELAVHTKNHRDLRQLSKAKVHALLLGAGELYTSLLARMCWQTVHTCGGERQGAQ